MNFLWRDVLLLSALIPVIIVVYIWMLRRRFTIRYSSLSLMMEARPERSWLRRHLPFIWFLFALANLVVALGRPVTSALLFSDRTTIILTIDVSRSMCMRDIPPDRLDAAKAAALSFVEDPVVGTQTGIVAFAGFAELAQAPTLDVNLLAQSIQSLSTSTETAIGTAILRALDAIAEVDQRVAPSQEIDTFASSPESLAPSMSPAADYVPHIIVLLTDGASNVGPPPILAAQQAVARGVRIYTIAFGTTKRSVMDCGTTVADNTYLSPGLESGSATGNFGTAPDEATLRQIANMTGGKFYPATSAAELQMVFKDLDHVIATTSATTEISVYFAALGALLMFAAVLLAFRWHPLL